MKIVVAACLAVALLAGCGGSSRSAPTQTDPPADRAINPLVAEPIETGSDAKIEATTRGQAATSSYLTARRALATQIERSRTARRRAAGTYVAEAAASCAGALKNAPRGKPGYVRHGSELMLDPQAILFLDATVGVERAMDVVDANAIKEFARETKGLRWTDPALTNLVNALAYVEGAPLEEMPELCRDALAWAASGYSSLGARTSHAAERFGEAREVLSSGLAKEGCVGPYPGRAVLHVLERRVSPGKRKTAEELSRLEARVDHEDGTTVNDGLAQIEKVLGSRLSAENGTPHTVQAGPACDALPSTGRR